MARLLLKPDPENASIEELKQLSMKKIIRAFGSGDFRLHWQAWCHKTSDCNRNVILKDAPGHQTVGHRSRPPAATHPTSTRLFDLASRPLSSRTLSAEPAPFDQRAFERYLRCNHWRADLYAPPSCHPTWTMHKELRRVRKLIRGCVYPAATG